MSKQQHPIDRLLRRSRLHVLGVNTGTSIDALDMALVAVDMRGGKPQLRATARYRIPPALRGELQEIAASNTVDKKRVTLIHYRLGTQIAGCVEQFRQNKFRKKIDLIGCHGQTIGHFPGSLSRRRRPQAATRHLNSATWQIGAAPVIAQHTGIVTVGDFRAADIAAGGMGAPLSGYYHYLMFGSDHVVLNLGGIANISAARRRNRRLEILAFDIGPGNMVTDTLAARLLKRPFDREGKVAAKGVPDTRIVARALRHRYFQRQPPKTCGREEFGLATVWRWFGRRLHRRAQTADCLATAAAITATAVARAVDRWIEPYTPSRSLILCGGGVRNETLVGMIRGSLPEWVVQDSGDLGIDPQYVEPMGFAILAGETLLARPGNRGGATGAEPAVLGSLSLPTVTA